MSVPLPARPGADPEPASLVFRDSRIDSMATREETLIALDRHRRRRRWRRAVTAAGGLVIASAVVVAAVAGVDWAIGWMGGRWGVGSDPGHVFGIALPWVYVVASSAAVVGAYRFVVLRCGRLEHARCLESSDARWGQSLRTLVQSDPPVRSAGSTVLETLLAESTINRLRREDDPTGERTKSFRTWAAAAAVVAVAAAAWLGHWSTRVAVARSLGGDVGYRRSVLETTPAVLRGEDATMTLVHAGWDRPGVRLYVASIGDGDDPPPPPQEIGGEDDDGRWREVDWRRDERSSGEDRTTDGEGWLSTPTVHRRAELSSVEQSLACVAMDGGDVVARGRLDVIQPVRVESVRMIVTPPAYTGLSPRRYDETDIEVAEGSVVELHVTTSRPIPDLAIDHPSRSSDSAGPGEDRFRWTAVDSHRFTLSGHDADGIPLETFGGHVRVVRDKPPRVDWLSPSGDATATAIDEVPMKIRVKDDYGILEAGIEFDWGDATGNVLADFRHDDDGPPPNTRTIEDRLMLEYLSLTQRDFIAYRGYAVDNRDAGSSRVETATRYLDIRPLRLNFRVVELDPNQVEGLQRLRLRLDEAIARQRQLIRRTGELATWPTDRRARYWQSVERHTQSQSDLADRTREIRQNRIEEGSDDVDSLSAAEASMLSAVDSLGRDEFDVASVQQQAAGRSLVEARNGVDVILATNAPRGMGRTAALRSLRMRLQRRNRDRREGQRRLAEEIRQLAGRQRQLAMRAEDPSTDAAESAAEQNQIIQSARLIDRRVDQDQWRTSLVNDRMDDAMRRLDDHQEALDRSIGRGPASDGDRAGLRATMDRTADDLDELAYQVDGLAMDEPSPLIERMTRSMEAMTGSGGRRSSESFNRGRSETLLDWIRSGTIGDGLRADEAEAAEAFEQWLDDLPVEEALGEMAERPGGEDDAAGDDDATASTGEASDDQSSEATLRDAARSLRRLYRSIASPRLERLRNLRALSRRLGTDPKTAGPVRPLAKPAAVSGRVSSSDALGELGRGLLRDRMDAHADRLRRAAEGGGESLADVLADVESELKRRIEEILLREFEAGGEVAVPDGYDPVVRDYYRQLLASEGVGDDPGH